MNLRVSQLDRALLDRCVNDAVLGIITSNGKVVLRVADRVRYSGHREWLRRDKIRGVLRGFSLVVKEGRVVGLLPMSVLNQTRDGLLEEALVKQVEQLLPLGEAYVRFRE